MAAAGVSAGFAPVSGDLELFPVWAPTLKQMDEIRASTDSDWMRVFFITDSFDINFDRVAQTVSLRRVEFARVANEQFVS
jgi:hypothetical protein